MRRPSTVLHRNIAVFIRLENCPPVTHDFFNSDGRLIHDSAIAKYSYSYSYFIRKPHNKRAWTSFPAWYSVPVQYRQGGHFLSHSVKSPYEFIPSLFAYHDPQINGNCLLSSNNSNIMVTVICKYQQIH